VEGCGIQCNEPSSAADSEASSNAAEQDSSPGSGYEIKVEQGFSSFSPSTASNMLAIGRAEKAKISPRNLPEVRQRENHQPEF